MEYEELSELFKNAKSTIDDIDDIDAAKDAAYKLLRAMELLSVATNSAKLTDYYGDGMIDCDDVLADIVNGITSI